MEKQQAITFNQINSAIIEFIKTVQPEFQGNPKGQDFLLNHLFSTTKRLPLLHGQQASNYVKKGSGNAKEYVKRLGWVKNTKELMYMIELYASHVY